MLAGLYIDLWINEANNQPSLIYTLHLDRSLRLKSLPLPTNILRLKLHNLKPSAFPAQDIHNSNTDPNNNGHDGEADGIIHEGDNVGEEQVCPVPDVEEDRAYQDGRAVLAELDQGQGHEGGETGAEQDYGDYQRVFLMEDRLRKRDGCLDEHACQKSEDVEIEYDGGVCEMEAIGDPVA